MTSTEPRPPRKRLYFHLAYWLALIVFFTAAETLGSWRWLVTGARLAWAALLLFGLFYLFRLLWRKLFWRVGRRLAFSYFLVGVFPMGLIALLAMLSAYLAAGFIVGHLYRDRTREVSGELVAVANQRLAVPARPVDAAPNAPLRIADYADGLRVSGPSSAPTHYPAWLAESLPAREGEQAARLVTLDDGTVTLAFAASAGKRGVVAWFAGGFDSELRRRGRLWAGLTRPGDPRERSSAEIWIGHRHFRLRGFVVERNSSEEAEFFQFNPPRQREPAWTDRPVIPWSEKVKEIPALSTGETALPQATISLASSPLAITRALEGAGGLDSDVWLALVAVAVLLGEAYLAAAALAMFMIFGLSRAVDRLSKATQAVGRGDFSIRIRVRRKDQLGALQRSFNAMIEHLEGLIATAAEKEAIEKELALARSLQRELIPSSIVPMPRIEIATHFEPSAAIGGDYFDLFPHGERITVAIADAAGHGLAAGLRMAMLKSALTLLVEESLAPEETLARLHRLFAAQKGEKSFVTATLAAFDSSTGRLDLTNAGHPPAYVVRSAGEVEEIVLPSSPLGRLTAKFETRRLLLEAGDAVVFLSDGILESRDAAGELFGYERVGPCLSGPFSSADDLRTRLLAAVAAWSGGRPPDDDRTIVVLRYRPSAGATIPSEA